MTATPCGHARFNLIKKDNTSKRKQQQSYLVYLLEVVSEWFVRKYSNETSTIFNLWRPQFERYTSLISLFKLFMSLLEHITI